MNVSLLGGSEISFVGVRLRWNEDHLLCVSPIHLPMCGNSTATRGDAACSCTRFCLPNPVLVFRGRCSQYSNTFRSKST
jgi:hypothetical protein